MSTVEHAIARMLAVWGEPRTTDPEMMLAEYRRALVSTEPAVLAMAIDLAIDSETYWPRVADLRRHISTAAVRLAARRHRRPAEHEAIVDRIPSPEERAQVKEMMASFVKWVASQRVAEIEPKPLEPVDREAFRAMQRRSRNHHHRESR